MEFKRLLDLVGDAPVFETSLLFAGPVKPASVRLQLSRWVSAGRVYQLRRGLYALALPYQKVKPHPFLVANHLQRASYVSAQSALAFYGLIPDVVQVNLSATAGRPETLETPLGIFEFRHLQPNLLHGYRMIPLGNSQRALVATPEKALLDLVYFQSGGDDPDYLRELRLQNLERLDIRALQRYAQSFATPKMERAVAVLICLAQAEAQEYETL